MAYLIDIRKTGEDERSVQYYFEGDGFDIARGSGLISIDKLSGDVDVLEHSGKDWERLCDKVVGKLSRFWKSGQFPDCTDYAA